MLLLVFMFIVLEALQNGKGVITGGMLTSNVETEKGLLTLITTDVPGIQSNPILEAFGNAKTVRNNNSSRFGKFVEIQFDHKGRISGAAIRTYLLERSRVCQLSDPERNYHCFYMLCAAPQEELQKYKLENPRTFHYLNQLNCYEIDGLDESKEYVATKRAMDVVGISSEEQEAIFRVVAAILHRGFVTQSYVPVSVSQFMDDLSAEENVSCNRNDNANVPQNNLNKEPSLRSILSDPLSGAFLEDAMFVSCGHSFGGMMLRKVIEIILILVL